MERIAGVTVYQGEGPGSRNHSNASELLDLIARNRPGWMEQAACRGLPQEQRDWFHPTGKGSQDGMKAKRICEGCPVKRQCLEFGLEEGDAGYSGGGVSSGGIYGGTSYLERQRLRRRRQRGAA